MLTANVALKFYVILTLIAVKHLRFSTYFVHVYINTSMPELFQLFEEYVGVYIYTSF